LVTTIDDDGDDFPDGFEEPTTVMAPFSMGAVFGERFCIERSLGAGGMGTVYEATDLSKDGEKVALKVLKKAKLMDGEAQQRFRREAEILASINHPGIVQIKGFGQARDGTPWIAMERLHGETLRQRVQREGALTPVQLVPILYAVAEPLTEAHATGIVHRDLKPDNIFLTEDVAAPVKILDFGLSTSLSSKKLTRTGTVIGTPRYMSPEQIASAHASDGQADVYALGVIIYESLAGQSPFVASDHGQLLGAILTGRVEPLHAVLPDIPPEIEQVVLRAIARSTDERYRTPSEFARAFARAVALSSPAGGGIPQRPAFAVRRSAGSEGDGMNRSVPWPVIAAVLVGAIGIALGVGLAVGAYLWPG
jgi:serine/threonine-protein kinase